MKQCLVLLLVLFSANCSTPVQNVNSTTQADSSTQGELPPGLTRQKVLDLLNQKLAPIQVWAHMNTSSRVLQDFTPIYKQMIDDKVINCQWSESCLCWSKCRPTEERQYELSIESPEQAMVTGTLHMELGWRQITEVVGISKITDTSALAEYLFAYEAPDASREELSIFKKYEPVFRVDNRDTVRHKALLRLYDDGWRIEELQ